MDGLPSLCDRRRAAASGTDATPCCRLCSQRAVSATAHQWSSQRQRSDTGTAKAGGSRPRVPFKVHRHSGDKIEYGRESRQAPLVKT